MGLLSQLFRHKNTPPDGRAVARQSDTTETVGSVRGVGAIAAAAGVKTEHGMPAEFVLSLGELLARVPPHCVWPGRHDVARVLRIPATDVAPGLARGKAELSLARLVALAPEVFRWERGETDDPQVRLPIQKLLQQIRHEEPVPPSQLSSFFSSAGSVAERVPPLQRDANAADFAGEGEIIAEQLPSIIWEKRDASFAPPVAEVLLLATENVRAFSEPEFTPEPEMPAPIMKPPPDTAEVKPTISITATEPRERTVELRPSRDASISTTLRAVVLGSVAPATSANAPGHAAHSAHATHILAPRVMQAVPGTLPPVILGPSVVPSANDGGVSLAPRTAPDFAGLQSLFMTDAALDLAGVAALAAALPGVRACVISGTAGSAMVGDFSHGASAEEVRAASDDLVRIGGAATDTLHRGESDIALFLHDDACLAAVVTPGGFVPGVRERLARIAELLAGATPAR